MTGVARSVVFCGAWDEGPGYPRAAGLRQGLQSLGVAVRECRAPGLGAGKQRLLRQPWRWPAALLRHRRQRAGLVRDLRAALAAERPDAVLVPYPGHHVVGAVASASTVPVVLDLFLSAYDTVVEDRAAVAPGSLGANWLRECDARACAAADLVLLDTPANAAYVAALTGEPAERFAWLPLSDPDAVARPAPWPEPGQGPLEVLFFGTGVPLHGLRTLVDAVATAPPTCLRLVGGTAADRAHAQRALGPRLRLEPGFVDRPRLQELLDRCHLVAGVFGTSGKAQRVVPWKVVHALAAARPVITADTPAVCGWLDGSGALFTAPAGDASALAGLLRELGAAPGRVREAAAAARPAYDRHFAVERAGERWRDLLERAVALPRRRR